MIAECADPRGVWSSPKSGDVANAVGFALVLTASCEKHCPEDHALELRDGRVCFGRAREYPNPDLVGAPHAACCDDGWGASCVSVATDDCGACG